VIGAGQVVGNRPTFETLYSGTADSTSFSFTYDSPPNDFGNIATATDRSGHVTIWGPTAPTSGTTTVHVGYSHANGSDVPAWALTKNKDVQSTSIRTIDLVTMVDVLRRTLQTKQDAEVSADGNGRATQMMLVSGPLLYDLYGAASRRATIRPCQT